MNHESEITKKILWKNESTNEEIAEQLTNLAKDRSTDIDVRKCLKLAATRLSKLNTIVKNDVQLLQNNENTETQLNVLTGRGFDRHELTREYGYTKDEALWAETQTKG